MVTEIVLATATAIFSACNACAESCELRATSCLENKM